MAPAVLSKSLDREQRKWENHSPMKSNEMTTPIQKVLMTRKRCSILLILMMVIMPVAAAFNQCAVMSDRSSEVSETGSTDIACQNAMPAAQDKDQSDQLPYANPSCFASAGCFINGCVDCGTASLLLHPRGYSANTYGHFKESIINSLAFSPEIKPPITTL